MQIPVGIDHWWTQTAFPFYNKTQDNRQWFFLYLFYYYYFFLFRRFSFWPMGREMSLAWSTKVKMQGSASFVSIPVVRWHLVSAEESFDSCVTIYLWLARLPCFFLSPRILLLLLLQSKRLLKKSLRCNNRWRWMARHGLEQYQITGWPTKVTCRGIVNRAVGNLTVCLVFITSNPS